MSFKRISKVLDMNFLGRRGFIGLLVMAGLGFCSGPAVGDPLNLIELFSKAEKASPQLEAEREAQTEAKASTEALGAYAYPSLDLAGVDGTGFPGSGSPTPPGFGGIANSPYRVGAAVDAVATWTLFDLSEHYAVSASEYQQASARDRQRLARLEVDQEALRLYVEASRYLGLENLWLAVVARIEPVQKVVQRFVLSGRYNQVQELLLQDQRDQAQLQAVNSQEAYEEALKRLALALGEKDAGFEVPEPRALDGASLEQIEESGRSPLLDLADDELDSAAALSSSANAENFPRLYVQGSVGAMQDERLVSASDYSGWVGVTVPIFSGFRIASEQLKAQASYWQKKDEGMQTQLDVDDENTQLDSRISLAQNQLESLAPQLEAADKNFNLAKDRYLNFLGTVTDLEESIRNLAQIQSEMNDAQAGLYLASGDKRLFNGGAPRAVPEEETESGSPSR
jgi:outer membrane protein TolC